MTLPHKISFTPITPQFDQLKAKLIARSLTLLLFLEHGLRCLYYLLQEDQPPQDMLLLSLISLSCVTGLAVIICAEYVIHIKQNRCSAKSAKLFDLALFLIFTLEWVSTIFITLSSPYRDANVPLDSLNIFTFTSFAWRILIQSMTFHYHQISPVPPTCAYILLMALAIHKQPDRILSSLSQGILQLVVIAIVSFLEHKKLSSLISLTNQQNSQGQLTDFILDHTMDKVMILGPSGDLQFMSCELDMFMYECGYPNNVTKFLSEIKELQRYDDTMSGITSPIRCKSLLEGASLISISVRKQNSYRTFAEKIESLRQLLEEFRELIAMEELEERKFLVYAGKLNAKDIEKSLEIRIAYMNQRPNQSFIIIIRDNEQTELISTLQNSGKYKDQLLASVSHELRTPLNGNINLVEAAIRAKDVPEIIKDTLLAPALKSSKFLLYLINDILDMAQIQARKLRLIFQPANLRETFINSLQLVELQAKKKGIKLETNFDSELPNKFCTDHVRLSQIVLNLLNNSIKFTEEGFVRISATLESSTSLIRVSIEDSGIGMKQDDVDKLFSDFTHIEHENRASINPTGVGLGLNIAHNLAQLLGPKGNAGITVSSVQRQGSVFSFKIQNKGTGLKFQKTEEEPEDDAPIIPDEMDIEMEKTVDLRMTTVFSGKYVKKLSELNSSPKQRCQCPKILVVDDDPFNIMAFESILMSLDAKCDCVYSGKSGIDKLLNRVRYSCSEHCRPYRVVFMDQEMPGMTGVEAAKEIRNLQLQNVLPLMKIIGCSAHDSQEETEKFMKAGATRCIKKPLSRDAVKEVLDKYDI